MLFPVQVNRGIKGIVRDVEGNALPNATISVEGIRHDVKTGMLGTTTKLLCMICIFQIMTTFLVSFCIWKEFQLLTIDLHSF